ncbi:3'(2'),5'-bisphosphate nucleotidase CysQ [Aliihoeflea sp. 2WW]|uniref:3'(2'),5'-bisphosphate nucleotidase CysQ n=1 Tax=Aliihoeflea sp. 2WW TaxID=1381123 RepID=UPI0004642CBC|nr:3'(2'),5'-bisphosphate nucleotidase CysQ [Aliihoeflea sp. 2WW]
MLANDDHAELALIREAAREAGRIAMRYFGKTPDVWMKTGQSPVTEADIAVDRFLKAELLAARPDYGWLSEETVADTSRLSARRTFVVDPIDGTRGFINGLDMWCVSIAIVEDGRPIAGVLDAPVKEQIFEATRDGPALRDGEAIKVRVAGDVPIVAGPKTMTKTLLPGIGQTVKVPYIPSLAYRIAMVADGEIDATFVKPNAHDWDLAAADLILRRAGGEVLTPQGVAPLYAGTSPRHGTLVAGSGALLTAMIEEARDPDWSQGW